MNVETPVSHLFDDLGYTTIRTDQSLQEKVSEHEVVIRVSQVGGPSNDVRINCRCVIEVYAATYDPMWDAATEVARRLHAFPFRADPIVIDKASCESDFAERPLSSDTRVVTSTWLLTARYPVRRKTP